MEIAVVIDSCVFIGHFRSKNKENTLLSVFNEQRLKLYVPSVAKYVVLSGAHEKDMDEWRRIFEKIIVLPFDDSTVDTARMIYRQLKQESKLIDLADTLIAATAIINDLPLATFNHNHFERIRGLRLV